MNYVKHSIIVVVGILSVCVSLSGSQSMRLEVVGSHKPYISEAMTNKLISVSGSQSMRLEVVGSQKPYISEAMTNKLISVALAGMRESEHWSHFVPSQKVLVGYCPQGMRSLGITNAFWDVSFTPRGCSEYHIGGGVSVKLDANSFKVLSVLGTK